MSLSVRPSSIKNQIHCILFFYLFIEVTKLKKCIIYLYFLFQYIIFILYINFKLYFILLLMSSGIFIFLRNLF